MANREHIASAVNIGDSESDVRLYLLIPGRMEVASFYVWHVPIIVNFACPAWYHIDIQVRVVVVASNLQHSIETLTMGGGGSSSVQFGLSLSRVEVAGLLYVLHDHE